MNRFSSIAWLLIINIVTLPTLQTREPKIKNPGVDILIFSYNRPMQLFALLESCTHYLTGQYTLTVLYRTSDSAFETGYQIVANDFPAVRFVAQEDPPYTTFKSQFLSLLFHERANDYFMCAVDDIIVTDHIDLRFCIDALETHAAHGFFLRLGTNITDCYTIHKKCGLPSSLTLIAPTLLTWQFKQGTGDWCLPASTDMTLYRKKDMYDLFERLSFFTPNDFESYWIQASDTTAFGLCYPVSKIVNIPLNIVQPDKTHRNMNFFSCEELLEEFINGFKIDIKPLSMKENNNLPFNTAPHAEYVPEFIRKAPHS